MRGLERFTSHFKGFESSYMLIGGAAAEILLEEVGLSFRATKDLDIVILLEDSTISDFTRALKEFVAEGGYEPQVGKDGTKHLYRFVRPSKDTYPAMLELFSWVELPIMDNATRAFHLSNDVVAASLSALLLDEAYYELLKQNGRVVDGVHVLDVDTLILFKMKAWLDLSERYAKGDQSVDSRNVKKHLNDVLRLQRLLDPNKTKTLDVQIAQDVIQFIERADVSKDVLRSLKLKTAWDDIAATLRNYYL